MNGATHLGERIFKFVCCNFKCQNIGKLWFRFRFLFPTQISELINTYK